MVLAGVLLLAGAGLLAGAFLAPNEVQRVYGAVKVKVDETVQTVKVKVGETVQTDQEDTFEVLPEVALGVSGGIPELDRCDGTFTEMLSYEHAGVPPVWAAHNNCGGDVLLPWDVGQRLRFAGSEQVYEVVDVRTVPKTWSTTADLVGLGGDLALQTCFYGEDRMKFIGLTPVD